MKYIQKILDFNIDIKKLKSSHFAIVKEIKEWPKDDPNLYDFMLFVLIKYRVTQVPYIAGM